MIKIICNREKQDMMEMIQVKLPWHLHHQIVSKVSFKRFHEMIFNYFVLKKS